MEKTSQRKTYRDPALNKIVQEKAAWNRQVSTFINDLIHLKKSMNGWPSKFYKERTRISQPAPIDLAGILSKMSGDFQELANQGSGIVQEQKEFAQSHVKRQSDRTLGKLEQNRGPATGPAPETSKPGGSDLSQQMGKQLGAAAQTQLMKIASSFEDRYLLEAEASNPISRFVTRLFNPRYGFGESARIRRLRMAMLDNCVKSYKEIRKLHKEIVRSSKSSITTSYKMMTVVWNYWNAVNRLFSTYKAIRPDAIVGDSGGEIETDPELKREKALEEGRDPDESVSAGNVSVQQATKFLFLLKDYKAASGALMATKSPAFHELDAITTAVVAAPKDKKTEVLLGSNLGDVYRKALQEVNTELGTNGSSFQEIVMMAKPKAPTTKEAQRQLGKFRHQILPGATSGQRLEIYQFLTQIRTDMDNVMNLLEKGFDQEQLSAAIGQVSREMSALRMMMRSLYHAEKPEEASNSFF
jgi:hypothetical protein